MTPDLGGGRERRGGSAQATMEEGRPLRARWIVWPAAAALAVRLLAFAQEAATPYLGSPILDERWYDGAARTLLGWPGGISLDGFRPLAYPAFLAAIYAGAGPEWGPVAAVAVQHLLGVATGVLVALLAWRLARSETAAVAAGALWALAGPPIFTEGQLLSETLFVPLSTAALLATLAARTPRRHAAAGALIGLAGQARANALILGVVVLGSAWRGGGEGREAERPGSSSAVGRGRSRAVAMAAALGALLAVHLVALALQAPVNGGFRLLPSSGAVNLYLGNERGADGMLPRQDAPVPAGAVYEDSVEAWARREFLAAQPGVERAEPAVLDRYWLRRTADEIAACPWCWARLVARKIVLLLWNEEIPNHRSFAFAAREDLPVLAWLPVRWWLLLALAPLGAAWVHLRGRGRLLPACAVFLLLLALGIVAFFVNGRYRLPLWPPLVALAGCGIAALVNWARARDPRRLAAGGAAAVVGATLALVNWTGAGLPSAARDLFFRSVARLERGELQPALVDARASVGLDPTDPAAQVQLGNAALAAADLGLATAAYRQAVALDPGQPIAWNNLGVSLERAGDRQGALAAYARARGLDPAYPLDPTAIERLSAPLAPGAPPRTAAPVAPG